MKTSLVDLFIPDVTANRIYGVVVGIVTNNQDPEDQGRVKVRFPWLSESDESAWARIATLMAGEGRGSYFLPEVDDEVLVAFEHGDVRFPYILGSLWNGRDQPPESNANGKNNIRTLQSRSGHIIRLDDTAGSEKIEIIANNASCSITLDANGKLTLAGKEVEITAETNIRIEAKQNLEAKAGPQLNLQGQVINLN